MPHERDARADELLAQHRTGELARLPHEPVALGLQLTTNHEERRVHAAPPIGEILKAVSWSLSACLRDTRDVLDATRDLAGTSYEIAALGACSRFHLSESSSFGDHLPESRGGVGGRLLRPVELMLRLSLRVGAPPGGLELGHAMLGLGEGGRGFDVRAARLRFAALERGELSRRVVEEDPQLLTANTDLVGAATEITDKLERSRDLGVSALDVGRERERRVGVSHAPSIARTSATSTSFVGCVEGESSESGRHGESAVVL